MTSPYPPYQPPRKLVRSRNDRVLGGVCGGIANYVNMDATLVRVLTVALSVFTGGTPILIYLVALFLMPEEDTSGPDRSYPPVTGPQWTYGEYGPGDTQNASTDSSYAPAPSPQASPAAPHRADTPEDRAVWGEGGAPWEQSPTGTPRSSASGDGTDPRTTG